MGDFKVWIAEEHALFAVVSDGYAGHNDVHVAVVQRREEAFPWLVFEFDFEVAGFSHGVHQVNVKTFHFACRIQRFKWGKLGVGADTVHFIGRSRGIVALTTAGSQGKGRTSEGSGQPFFHVHDMCFLNKMLTDKILV